MFSRSFDRQTVVKNLGLYTYHLFDITLQSKSSAERVFASGDGFSEIKTIQTQKTNKLIKLIWAKVKCNFNFNGIYKSFVINKK